MRKNKFPLFTATMLVLSGVVNAQTLSVQPIEMQIGEQTEVVTSITGGTAMTALQFNLTLPEGVEVDPDRATRGTAIDDHTLSVQTLDDGDLLFILYSMDQNSFKDGELLRIPITAGNKAVTATGRLYTVRTATSDAVSMACEDASFSITISEPQPEGFSNDKLYSLTCKRGGMVMNAEGNGLAAGQTRTDAPESDQRFAIITYNDEQYLYSPAAKKYLNFDGNFVSRLGTPITFDETHADGDYKYMLLTQNATGELLYFNNNGRIVIDSWDTPDEGNRWRIEPVDDFDPTEALKMAAKQICTVTYEVQFDGKVVSTATETVSAGSDLPEPPASLSNSYVTLTANSNNPRVVNEDVTATYTATWSGPFTFTKALESAKWYNMHIRSGYYVGKQDSEPYYPTQVDEATLNTEAYQWAFGGDPYHVLVYNRTTGLDETLTKEGDNAVMRSGEYAWELLPNADGFVLREAGTANTCINQLGGNIGPLQFWTDASSPTDNGSTFRVEETPMTVDINVLIERVSSVDVVDIAGRRIRNIARPGIYVIGRRKVVVK